MPEETKLPTNDNTPDGDVKNDLANMDDQRGDYPADESAVNFMPDDAQHCGDLPNSVFEQLNERLQQLVERYESRTSSLESYLKIVGECQKEMAKFANGLLERHALHPAIETVDSLASLIEQLHEQAVSLVADQIQCPLFKPMFDSLADASKVARAKREYLDMEAICPQQLDDLDPDKHDIRQVVQTDDACKHRKIEKTVTPGLIYHGKVLRQAKVSVYRHNPNQ